MPPEKDTVPIGYAKGPRKHERYRSENLNMSPNYSTPRNVSRNDRCQNRKKSDNNYSRNDDSKGAPSFASGS